MVSMYSVRSTSETWIAPADFVWSWEKDKPTLKDALNNGFVDSILNDSFAF